MNETAKPFTGGCACGRVRYAISQPPIAVRVCWCRECQYLATGNGSVNVRLPRTALTLEGELTGWESVADSGNTVRRSFCARCGTPVLSESSGWPDLVTLRAGTLDDPDAVTPQWNIWTDSAPSWACIDEALPSTPRQPG